jgi:hypothetical protein
VAIAGRAGQRQHHPAGGQDGRARSRHRGSHDSGTGTVLGSVARDGDGALSSATPSGGRTDGQAPGIAGGADGQGRSPGSNQPPSPARHSCGQTGPTGAASEGSIPCVWRPLQAVTDGCGGRSVLWRRCTSDDDGFALGPLTSPGMPSAIAVAIAAMAGVAIVAIPILV